MTISHTFNNEEFEANLLHAFVFLNTAQCNSKYWNDESYGLERTHALRYVEATAVKTNWEVAMAAIRLYAPRVVEIAEIGVKYFLSHYPSDEKYMAMPQVFAICKMLDDFAKKKADTETSNPLLAKPPKTKKKK